jgi:sugar phosphate isomerase/epimerase
MKIGLDCGPISGLLKMGSDPLGLLDLAIGYGFEGVLLSSRALREDEALRRQVIEKARANDLYIELGGSGIDSALSGRSTEELVESWKPLFPLAAEIGSPTLNTGLGTWPWEGRVIQEAGRTLADQIAGGIATLRALRPMAEEWGGTITIHTSFNTAAEYVQIVEAVDSPNVGLCLDTANAFLVLEDPVDFARRVAPWVCSTHFKDSCIYLQEEGIHWLGGCALGRGAVDLEAIADLIYEAHPECNLSIEDHWGRSTQPMFAPAFLSSLGEWDGDHLDKVFRHLWQGQALVQAGMHPTEAEAKQLDWSKIFPERQRTNAAYAKQLRDRVVARHRG